MTDRASFRALRASSGVSAARLHNPLAYMVAPDRALKRSRVAFRQQLKSPARFGGAKLFRLLVPSPRYRNAREYTATAYTEVFQFDRIVGRAEDQGSVRVPRLSRALQHQPRVSEVAGHQEFLATLHEHINFVAIKLADRGVLRRVGVLLFVELHHQGQESMR